MNAPATVPTNGMAHTPFGPRPLVECLRKILVDERPDPVLFGKLSEQEQGIVGDARDQPFIEREAWLSAALGDDWPELLAEIRGSFTAEQSTGSDPDDQPPEFTGPPRPLRVELRPVPRLTPEMIPLPFRAWIQDTAERVGCSIEYPAVGAIVALSAVAGRKVGIRPRALDDWTVVPNLWGAIVGRPGILKSPALSNAMKPLNRLAAEALERHEQALRDFEADCIVAKAKAKVAKKDLDAKAKKGASDEVLKALARQSEAGEKEEKPTARRYIVNDATLEALGDRLKENPNGLLTFRDELTGFLRGLDKQGRESDRAFYLETWDGRGSFTYDRIGRGTIHIPHVCLSILGGIQPGPLASYIREAMGEQSAGNDGLIVRFQMLVYPDQVPWVNIDRAPDIGAYNRALDVFREIDALDPGAIRAERDDRADLPFLHFDRDAQELFNDWRNDLEAKVRGGESVVIESHLAKYRSLMPSLALLFHLVEIVDDEPRGSGPVTHRAARLAIQWCAFLEEHARRIYQAASDGDFASASLLLERLRDGRIASPFKAREVWRKHWTRLDTPERVEQALAILEDHGWVKPVETAPESGLGRPTTTWFLHPDVAPEISVLVSGKGVPKVPKVDPNGVSALLAPPENGDTSDFEGADEPDPDSGGTF